MPPPTVSVTRHEGGVGLCDVCHAESDVGSVVHSYAPKRLCPRCSDAFINGDDRTVAAVFVILPEDTSARARRRQPKAGR
jgi:hypothetical protein